MSNDNGNGKNSNSSLSTSNSVESSELGEVKTALGRLYKEVESLKQSQKTERERDRAELQAWAQTNLIQNQLLSKAMVTIEMLTEQLKTQNLSTNELEKNNADLMQQLTLFMTQLQNTPTSSPTLESLEFKGLKSEVSALKSSWQELMIHTNQLTQAIKELKNSPTPKPTTIEREVVLSDSGNGCLASLGTGFAFLLLFFLINKLIPVKISDDIHEYLQSIAQQTGWTNTKLQRVERRLGTDPNRRR
jgi:hypothetical protein